MGDEREAVEFISELLNKYDENTSLEYKVYHLVCKQNVNGTRIRNAMIIREYDRLKPQYRHVTTLFGDLAYNYCISTKTIENVIYNRKINEI